MGKCWTKMAAQKDNSDVIKGNWKQGLLNGNVINRLMNTILGLLLTMKFANIHGKLGRGITPLERLQGKTLQTNYAAIYLMMIQCSSHIAVVKPLALSPLSSIKLSDNYHRLKYVLREILPF